MSPAGEAPEIAPPELEVAHTGSLSKRMMLIAAGWILTLLTLGGVALDRVLTSQMQAEFDNRLVIPLNSMLRSAELDPFGEVRFNSILGDQQLSGAQQRFLLADQRQGL